MGDIFIFFAEAIRPMVGHLAALIGAATQKGAFAPFCHSIFIKT
jgi:hypothetical protein